MGMNKVAMAFGNIRLELFNGLIGKLFNRTATGTDQMVVVLAFNSMLKPCLAVPEMNFTGNTRFGKKLESPIYSRITDIRMFGAQGQIQLLYTHVLIVGEETIQDYIPLAG
jgi:hypothetical protein